MMRNEASQIPETPLCVSDELARIPHTYRMATILSPIVLLRRHQPQMSHVQIPRRSQSTRSGLVHSSEQCAIWTGRVGPLRRRGDIYMLPHRRWRPFAIGAAALCISRRHLLGSLNMKEDPPRATAQQWHKQLCERMNPQCAVQCQVHSRKA